MPDDVITSPALLIDCFERINETLREVLHGLTAEQLMHRPTPDANSIAWLAWHQTRVQDDHIADVAGQEQVWTAGGWAERCGLPFRENDIGYGHSSAQVAEVVVDSPDLLLEYQAVVHGQTLQYLSTLSEADLTRVVDERWDPPVTLAVRLVSVVSDDLQHVGQAAYLRGLLKA